MLNKKLILIIFLTVFFCSCMATRKARWEPYIGCSEQTLIDKWGKGGNITISHSQTESSKILWYTYGTRIPFAGFVLPIPVITVEPGKAPPVDPFYLTKKNIKIIIEDNKITSISYQ